MQFDSDQSLYSILFDYAFSKNTGLTLLGIIVLTASFLKFGKLAIFAWFLLLGSLIAVWVFTLGILSDIIISPISILLFSGIVGLGVFFIWQIFKKI